LVRVPILIVGSAILDGEFLALDESGLVQALPGGVSLHNTILPHGPDVDAFERASNAELKPQKLQGTLAFMFETRFPQRVTAYASQSEALQKNYGVYGHRLKKHFNPDQP
jgi:homogentisate 1,2-dioxygenase